MAQLIVFTGYLGTGKSTLAYLLAKETNFRLLQIDKLRHVMIPRPEYNDQEMITLYHIMLSVAEIWLESGANVILDATFSKPTYHQLLKQTVDLTGSDLKVFLCYCSSKESLRRIKDRTAAGKNIAADVDENRYWAHRNRFKLISFFPVIKLNTETELNTSFITLKRYLFG